MRLIFSPAEFSWEKPMEIRDAFGNLRFTVTGDGYRVGKRIYIRDRSGRDAVAIRQTVPSLFPRFQIETYGKPVGELVRITEETGVRYTVTNLRWELEGETRQGCFHGMSMGRAVGACSVEEDPEERVVTWEEDTQWLPLLGISVLVACVLGPGEPRKEN